MPPTTREERITQHNRQVARVYKDGVPCIKIRRDDFILNGTLWDMVLYLELEEADHIKALADEFRKTPPVEEPA